MDDKNCSHFIKNFYGITISEKEAKRFEEYLTVLKLRETGLSAKNISEKINISKSTLEKWIFNNSKPFLAQLMDHRLNAEIGPNKKWLSINSTRGGLFTGPWIKVPEKIENFQDIENVISQLEELNEFNQKNNDFEFPVEEKNRHILFVCGLHERILLF